MHLHKSQAVVLLSGGLDSATTAAMARERGFALHALTCDYGQRHRVELECAQKIAQALRVADHRVIAVDLRLFGGSCLTASEPVPKHVDQRTIGSTIPTSYVPARNTVLLALALAHAEVVGANDIFIGANAVDYSGYPDCRPEFIAAFEHLARVATRAGVEGAELKIHAPLLAKSKADIIREGARLGVDFSLTHSCYDPKSDGRACGACESCVLRKQGFTQAGIVDPIRYVR